MADTPRTETEQAAVELFRRFAIQKLAEDSSDKVALFFLDLFPPEVVN